MKRALISLTGIVLIFALLWIALFQGKSSGQEIAWSKQLGTSAEDYASTIVLDSQSNIYLVGVTKGSLYGTNAGSSDIFVCKYASDGTLLWSHQYGSSGDDSAACAMIDGSDNLYIAGNTTGDWYGTNAGDIDTFILKLSSGGTVAWGRQFGTTQVDLVRGISKDSQNNALFLAGETSGSLFGTNPEPEMKTYFYVAKYDLSGNQLWGHQFGNGDDSASDIAVDSQSNIYVVGSTIDFLQQNLGENGETDAFLVKLTSDGSTLLWGRQFGTNAGDEASAIVLDESGNPFVVGVLGREDVPGPDSAFIAKYDPNGNQLWLRQLNTSATSEENSYSGSEGASDICIGDQGNALLVGSTGGDLFSTNAGEEDNFLAEYDANGNILQSIQFGTSADEVPIKVIVDSDGAVYVSGFTEGSLYGTNAGKADAFIVKLGAVSMPSCNPDGGTYQSAQNVTISSATSGATIRYTTDGTTPTESSTQYTSPVAVNNSLALKAKAWKTDYLPSNVKTAEYELKLPTPTFNPDAGAYQETQDITISCAIANASIMYTLDNSEPTEQSPAYTGPVSIDHSLSLNAKAFKSGWTASDIKSAFYYIGDLPAPTFNPDGGTYQGTQNVAISCTISGATIRYTTDGTDPTESSAAYTGPVAITQSATLKAKAFKTDWTASDIKSASYTIE